MRYWLSVGDGKSYGPYEIGQLHSMRSSGRIGPTAQLCAEGSQQWVPATSVLSQGAPIGAPIAPPTFNPAALTSGSVSSAWTDVSLVGPILVTLLCCVPGGVVSIVYATQANSKGRSGDIAGASVAANASKVWAIVSVVLGFGAVAIGILIQIAAES